jgi:hypothetical protein
VQNVVPLRAMGSATALTQFARAIGATVGVTAMGVIVNHGLSSGNGIDRLSVHRLAPSLREDLASAMQPAFLAASLLCVPVLVIVALWLREVPLRRDFEEEPSAGVPEAARPVAAQERS